MDIKKIIALAKRRGVSFLSSEIYGGFGSVYDYGPIGSEIKNNIKNAWRENYKKDFSTKYSLDNHGMEMIEIDAGILMSPKVWEASGHLSAGFADELVECKKCHKRYKGDDIKEKCPDCGGELTDPKQFNLMMRTFVGPAEDSASTAYLRAETCQGIFVNFKNVIDSWRTKLPFGIMQIGKSFRNEITPGNFIFRTREFEQMEMQWFFDPEGEKTADEWFDMFKKHRYEWYLSLGFNPDNLKFEEITEGRSHYAKRQLDVMYKFPFGWQEVEGIHYRGDWDLSNHEKFSKQKLSIDGKIPHVIETSVGVERAMLAVLVEGYSENDKEEITLNLHPKIAPIKIAVLPIVGNKEEITNKAEQVFALLKKEILGNVYYDKSGSIGKRYRRQDEIGTPYCVTVDFDTLENDKVTIRDRSTQNQTTIEINKLVEELKKRLYV